MLLFYETTMKVNEKEANNALVLYYSHMVSSRAGVLVTKYLHLITTALICSIVKDQESSLHDNVTTSNNNNFLILKISLALVTLMANAEKEGTLESLREAMLSALSKDCFNGLS